MRDLKNVIRDRFCYFTQSAYLKFPHTFRKRFGIGTGMKLNTTFPNPEVSVDNDEEHIDIIYRFKIDDLKNWQQHKNQERQP